MNLQPQYDVVRTDAKPLGFHFVLEPGADPLAVEALILYACLVEDRGDKELAKKLTEITRQYRTMICHDCSWTGFPEQMLVKRGKRTNCPVCDMGNVHKKVVEADVR
jgi:rubrerythrin